jgi:hypothetical protein
MTWRRDEKEMGFFNEWKFLEGCWDGDEEAVNEGWMENFCNTSDEFLKARGNGA